MAEPIAPPPAASSRITIRQILPNLVTILSICAGVTGIRMGFEGRFGLIRFGSRLDIYLPDGAVARVAEGQKAVAGETVIAEFGAGHGAWTWRRD